MWKSLEGLDVHVKSINVYQKLLEDRRIRQSEKEDELIWASSNNGNYNVKDGYRTILDSQRWDGVDISLKLCWHPSCLPKAGFFL